MQELHLVGFTTDRRSLIFGTRRGGKSGSFLVPVDTALVDAVTRIAEEMGGLAAAGEAAPHVPADTQPTSQLSVREIQACLRAGEGVEQLAERAAVDPAWIERFAPPIRAEQAQIVRRALGTPLARARGGPSAVPLRRAVEAAMAERDVSFTADTFDAAWASRLVGADRWSVEFTFVNRGRERTVAWTYDAEHDELTTTDRFASQIGYVAESGTDSRPRPSPHPAPPDRLSAAVTKRAMAAKRAAAKELEEGAAKRSAATQRAAAKAAEARDRAAAERARADELAASEEKALAEEQARRAAAQNQKPAAKKRAAKKAIPKKSSTRRSTPKQSTAKKPAAKKTARKATAEKATAEKAAEEPAVAPASITESAAPGAEAAATDPAAGRPPARPPSPDDMRVRLRTAGDRAAARRSRTLQRSEPTAQFRAGFAVQAGPQSDNGNTARQGPAEAATPERPSDRRREELDDAPRPEPASNGRRRRTEPLRAR